MVQTTVTNTHLATGIPGEFSRSENQDSIGVILNSAVEAENLLGRVVKFIDGNDYEVGIAADGNIAGILSTPKAAYRASLDAQDFLPNESQLEVATRGYLFVMLPAAAKKGDLVYFSDTTGSLITAATGVAPAAGHTRLPGGVVVRNNSGAGVGEIYIDILAGSTETPA
jgi:hypothetical protein